MKRKGRWGEEKELTKEIEKGKANKVDGKQEWGVTETKGGKRVNEENDQGMIVLTHDPG